MMVRFWMLLMQKIRPFFHLKVRKLLIQDCLRNILYQNTIRGKLHVTGICEILLNQKRFTWTLHNLRDVGNIFELCFERRKVIIFVDWYNHPPKQSEETDMF